MKTQNKLQRGQNRAQKNRIGLKGKSDPRRGVRAILALRPKERIMFNV
jgi:hypothetical protein